MMTLACFDIAGITFSHFAVRWIRRSRAVRDGRGSDHGLDHDPGPSGGCVQTGHDPRPSNRRRTAIGRNEARPSEPQSMVAESNNLDAICSAHSPDTNNRLPNGILGLDLQASRGSHGAAAVDRS